MKKMDVCFVSGFNEPTLHHAMFGLAVSIILAVNLGSFQLSLTQVLKKLLSNCFLHFLVELYCNQTMS